MRNAIQAMLNAVDREAGGVAIILCPDFGLRDWLVEEVESLVPQEAHPLRVSDVESALAEPTRLVLLIPKDDREAVLDLDASRDRILDAPGRTLSAWKPEVEEDEDDDGEETEPPEGPTDVELASAVGATKALVAKALKKLIADGLVEKLSGRPARYVATGDQA